MPIMLQRVYASDRKVDKGLGTGWSFVFDDRIIMRGETATLETGSGSGISFRRLAAEGRFVLETPQPEPHEAFDLVDPETVTEQVNGLTRTYKKIGASFRLSQIADRNGNRIAVSFDSRQNISRISASGGGSLTFEWSDNKDARLLAVSDSAGRRLSFRHDGSFLRTVIDPAGAGWSYEYQNGKLSRATDPTGRLLLRVSYDKSGRAVTVGDAVGMNRFEFESAVEGVSKRTTVIDSLGAQTIYEHNRLGALVGLKDDEGHSGHVEMNAANRPTHVYDSTGAEARFEYDTENRLTNQINSDGTQRRATYDARGQIASTTEASVRTEFTYDARGNTISAVSNDSSQRYRVNYNNAGQRISVTNDKGGAASFEYDAQGNEAAFTYAKAGRFETGRDRIGNIVSRRMPSGTTYAYEYDARGVVKRQSNDKGQAVTFERDASGATIRASFGKNQWISATRDEAGRIILVSNSLGKSRRFGYDSRGALKDYTDASGLRKQLEYDHRGRLRQISDSNGVRTTISRDLQGRIERIARLDKQGNRYDYDPAGKLVAVRRAQEKTTYEKASYASIDLSPKEMALGFFDDGSCFFGFDGDFGTGDPGMGGGPGFGGGDPFGGGGSCDPFLGLGGGGDPFMGVGSGESCYQCMARNQSACESTYHGCLYTATAVAIAAAGVCSLITGFAGTLICLAAAAAAQQLAIQACQQHYNACMGLARNNCPQCNG
jgi:YD repeat-containing protein